MKLWRSALLIHRNCFATEALQFEQADREKDTWRLLVV